MRKPSLFRRLVTSALIANCIILSPYGPPLARAASTVVIGEVAWAGSTLSTADEWIELWNLGDVPAEIGGYKLQQGSDGVITIPADAVIPPQSVYLVSNYVADDAKSALAATPQFVTTGVSLSNSALSITLLDAADGVVDQVGDGTKPPAGSSGTVKATMIPSGDSWIAATISQGFDEGRPELGTPGVCDGCQTPEPTPVVVEPLPVETPPAIADPVIVEMTPTETVDTPLAATSTEPIAEPVVPEAPAIESPVAEASSTPSAIPPCQVVYIPIGQPLPTPEVVEAPASAPDSTITDPMTVDPIMTALEPMLTIESVTTSSTEPTSPLVEQSAMLTDDATTSSTQPTSDPVTETATTTESLLTTTTTDVAPTATTSVEPVATTAADATPAPIAPAVPRYDLLRLNEFSAHPVGENEWIEIASLDANTSIVLDGVMLYDGAGKIYTFATGTLDAMERFATATLASSRLNNDGDTVFLKDPSGNVLDSVLYEGSKANWTWSRLPDGTGAWVETSISSPGDLNIVPPTETPAQATTSTPTTMSQTTTTTPIETVAPVSIAPPIMSVATSALTSTSASSTTPKKTVTKTKETKTTTIKETVTPKAAVTKTTTKTTTAKSTKSTSTSKATTKTVSIPSISFNMNDYETSRGIRVSLQGQVGSPSGLLSSHAFILLSPDGRGLQVRVPTAKKLPDMNEVVVVQGTLLFTDAGTPYLKLGANDDWKTITDATQTTKSRAANLFTPSAEDAWSLVSATGTVRRINASSATIEIDGADVDVAIKKILQYRLSRLSVGDVLSVTGLLDVSSDVPKIVPRSEQEIALIAHAPVQTAKGNPTGLPGWTPFGAAGVAIAGTEGLKQLRDRRKRQALEEIVETRLNTTV